MKSSNNNPIATAVLCACLMLSAGPVAQAAPEAAPVSPPAPADPQTGPIVPPAKPGVYLETKQSATRYRLTVKGHAFTSRDAIEKYLLYRAAALSLQQNFPWFTLAESRAKGDTAPVPKADRAGPRHAFRLNYWRPVWRYTLAGSPDWTTWSPFSDVAFFADGKDAKTITGFEISADIVMHKGAMDDFNPLAFDARAVSDLLVTAVSPPE